MTNRVVTIGNIPFEIDQSGEYGKYVVLRSIRCKSTSIDELHSLHGRLLTKRKPRGVSSAVDNNKQELAIGTNIRCKSKQIEASVGHLAHGLNGLLGSPTSRTTASAQRNTTSTKAKNNGRRGTQRKQRAAMVTA